uniref:PH domain-containing protein n=1 Tax=Parascaris univalens TaxID=6257 RepID=A0A915CIS8_PARUN
MILKQGAIYKYNTKGKWSDAWFIYAHNEDGPRFSLYKDSTTKKGPEVSVNITAIANDIRFGRTSYRIVNRPNSSSKDSRIHDSCFLSIPLEKSSKKSIKREVLWLCTLSVLELYDLVKLISYSLAVMKIQPPAYNHDDSVNSIYSLHRYKPMAFIAETTWERFYDCPPQQSSPAQTENSQMNRSSSMMALTEKKASKALKGKTLKNDQKEASKSLNTLSELPYQEYDEVPEVSDEKQNEKLPEETLDDESTKKLSEETLDDESKNILYSEKHYEKTIMKTPLDKIQLSYDSSAHMENPFEESPIEKQNSQQREAEDIYEGRISSVSQNAARFDHQNDDSCYDNPQEQQSDVCIKLRSTEQLGDLNAASKFTARISQSVDVEMQLSLSRCRELNEKPMLAPKPKKPQTASSPPLSISPTAFGTVTSSLPTPTKFILRAAPLPSRTISDPSDNNKNACDSDDVFTIVSFTLRPSEESKMMNLSETMQSVPLKLKISDLQVENGDDSHRVMVSIEQPNETPMAYNDREEDTTLLNLQKGPEFDEMDSMETLDAKIKGSTPIARSPSLISSPIAYTRSEYDLRTTNEANLMPNGGATQLGGVRLSVWIGRPLAYLEVYLSRKR